MSTQEGFQIDFSGVEARNDVAGFEPIEPGVYIAKITKAEFGFAKSGQNSPMVTMDWQIEGGPYHGRPIRFQRLVFSKGWAGVIKGVLISLGLKVPAKPVSGEQLGRAFARDAVGKLAQITVADGEPNQDGKVYAEVKSIHPIPNAPSPAASDSSDENLPEL